MCGYTVIGRRACVKGHGARAVQSLIGKTFSPDLTGALLSTLPDGVLFEQRGQWYVSQAQKLHPVNMMQPGECITQPEQNPPGDKDWRRDVLEEIELARRTARAWHT